MQSRLYVRKCSFSQRTINVWNKVNTDCLQLRSPSHHLLNVPFTKSTVISNRAFGVAMELTCSLSRPIIGMSRHML